MPRFVKGGTGRGCGKGSGWGWRPRLTEGEQICWVVELEGEKGVHLDQELTWVGRFLRGSPWVEGPLGAEAHLGLGGSWGPPPCNFFTSISLLRLRASRSFPKEPLRRKEPLPSCGVDKSVSLPH